MNLALQIGDSLIPGDRVLQQLSDSQLLPQLLREMVIDELIERVADKYQIDLTPTPEEFARLSEQVESIRPFRGMNSAQIEAITLRTLKLHKFKQAGWGHKVSGYYQTIQNQLYRLTYSILQVSDGLLAQELFFRLQSGEQSFAEVAVKYSQDASAPKGGLIGPILSRDLHPALAQVLVKLAPGELSPLFQLDNNYGFLRLNEISPPQLDENMHQLLLDELFETWIQAQVATEVGGNGEISLIDSAAPEIAPTTSVVAAQSPWEQTSENLTTETPSFSNLFIPEFDHQELNTVEMFTDETSSEVTRFPEVTVVTEPENPDLDVSTKFFFPDRAQESTPPAPNLSTIAAPNANNTVNPPVVKEFVLPPDLESTISPEVRSGQRYQLLSRLLVGSLGLTIVGSIALNQYLSHYRYRTHLLPEPLKGWAKALENKG